MEKFERHIPDTLDRLSMPRIERPDYSVKKIDRSDELPNDPSNGTVEFAFQNSKVRALTTGFLWKQNASFDELGARLPELHGCQCKYWLHASRDQGYLFITNYRATLNKADVQLFKHLQESNGAPLKLQLLCFMLLANNNEWPHIGIFRSVNDTIEPSTPLFVARGWQPGDFVDVIEGRKTPPWIWLSRSDLPAPEQIKVFE